MQAEISGIEPPSDPGDFCYLKSRTGAAILVNILDCYIK